MSFIERNKKLFIVLGVLLLVFFFTRASQKKTGENFEIDKNNTFVIKDYSDFDEYNKNYKEKYQNYNVKINAGQFTGNKQDNFETVSLLPFLKNLSSNKKILTVSKANQDAIQILNMLSKGGFNNYKTV